jgi:hypothetical protein
MRHFLFAAFLMSLAACGDSSNEPVKSGTGVIRNVSSIDFSGMALVDGDYMMDVSSVEMENSDLGSIVEYEAIEDSGSIEPAGVPQKVTFKKFQIIGIEN